METYSYAVVVQMETVSPTGRRQAQPNINTVDAGNNQKKAKNTRQICILLFYVEAASYYHILCPYAVELCSAVLACSGLNFVRSQISPFSLLPQPTFFLYNPVHFDSIEFGSA